MMQGTYEIVTMRAAFAGEGGAVKDRALEEMILEPRDTDVLLGRGGKNNQHVGNDKLRDLAKDVSDMYRKAPKKDKPQIAWNLVLQIRQLQPPGRFLKASADKVSWEEVSDDVSREKVSQCLRDCVSAMSKTVQAQKVVAEAVAAAGGSPCRPTNRSEPSILPSPNGGSQRFPMIICVALPNAPQHDRQTSAASSATTRAAMPHPMPISPGSSVISSPASFAADTSFPSTSPDMPKRRLISNNSKLERGLTQMPAMKRARISTEDKSFVDLLGTQFLQQKYQRSSTERVAPLAIYSNNQLGRQSHHGVFNTPLLPTVHQQQAPYRSEPAPDLNSRRLSFLSTCNALGTDPDDVGELSWENVFAGDDNDEPLPVRQDRHQRKLTPAVGEECALGRLLDHVFEPHQICYLRDT